MLDRFKPRRLPIYTALDDPIVQVWLKQVPSLKTAFAKGQVRYINTNARTIQLSRSTPLFLIEELNRIGILIDCR